jgi:enoyl-CoA hydratase/carnithine racemase
MEMKHWEYEKEDFIEVLTFDRPPINAINTEAVIELKEALVEFDHNNEIKVLILAGKADHAFIAHADLVEINDLIKSGDTDKITKTIRIWNDAFSMIETISKPVIAAIHGLTLGGGTELCLACDLRVMAEDSYMGCPEVMAGLIPLAGGTQRLPMLIGASKAKELILTGKIISSAEAVKLGLVTKIASRSDLLTEAKELAKHISNVAAPLAVRAAKQAINRGLQEPDLRKSLVIESESALTLLNTEDLKEGVNASIEHRAPKFYGK